MSAQYKDQIDSNMSAGTIGNSEIINALLHEYNGLVGENHLVLAGADRKLAMFLAAGVGFFGAGVWKSSSVLFLMLPFVIALFTLSVIAQLAQIVLIGAQLSVIEERINSELGKPVLSFFSSTVPNVCDVLQIHDPIRQRKYFSFNLYYGISAVIVFLTLCGYAILRGFPALAALGNKAVLAYFVCLVGCIVIIIILGIRASTWKHSMIALIKSLNKKRD